MEQVAMTRRASRWDEFLHAKEGGTAAQSTSRKTEDGREHHGRCVERTRLRGENQPEAGDNPFFLGPARRSHARKIATGNCILDDVGVSGFAHVGPGPCSSVVS